MGPRIWGLGFQFREIDLGKVLGLWVCFGFGAMLGFGFRVSGGAFSAACFAVSMDRE